MRYNEWLALTEQQQFEILQQQILNDREREVIECLFRGWMNDEMSLYGNLSYQDVADLMDKLGVDNSAFVKRINEYIDECEYQKKADKQTG